MRTFYSLSLKRRPLMCQRRVARELADDPESYAPVMEVDSADGELLWGPWINGFERAMRLRGDAWKGIGFGDDGEAAAAVKLILAMNEVDHGESELTEEAEDELDLIAPELIPDLVRTLNARTGAQAMQNVEQPGPERALDNSPAYGRKVARNEPCPCGSAQKYGQFCGAN